MWGPSPRLSLVFILSDSTSAPTFTSAGEEPLVEQLARAESARAGPHYAVKPSASLITFNLTSGLLWERLFEHSGSRPAHLRAQVEQLPVTRVDKNSSFHTISSLISRSVNDKEH